MKAETRSTDNLPRLGALSNLQTFGFTIGLEVLPLFPALLPSASLGEGCPTGGVTTILLDFFVETPCPPRSWDTSLPAKRLGERVGEWAGTPSKPKRRSKAAPDFWDVFGF